jgi:TPR repeat protein
MLDLGWLYFNGQGVKQDNARAYCWWMLADQFGNKQAMDAITEGSRGMKEGDIGKAVAVMEKILSKLQPVTHWADSIFEEYVTRY